MSMRYTLFKLLLGAAFVLQVTCVYAQQQTTLAEKFDAYRSKNFSEKIFLHTDQSAYLTGETLWFNIFHVDASFHKPLYWSDVIYVELIGPEGAVVQGKFSAGETTTAGSLFLPTSIASGNYELIAYTLWMKNYGHEYFFRQPIRVINPFVDLVIEKKSEPEYDIQFFPEGGNLVYGLESVVGVRAVDQNGSGISFQGALLNEQNDTLARFSPLKYGLGKFVINPEPGQTYRVVIKDQHKKLFNYKLPSIAANGYVVHVVELATKVRVKVSTNHADAGKVHLLVHTRQTAVIAESQEVKNGEAVFMIDKNRLGEGVSHFTVFNTQLKPVCERLWFKQPAVLLNLEGKIKQESFSVREKVALEIQSSVNKTAASLSNLSVVVYKTDSLDVPTHNIVNYLMLTSDLNGTVEHPGYYFENDSQDVLTAADNLMLTHGWRRFRWENIIESKNEVNNMPELSGHRVSGKIVDKITQEPIRGATAYLTFPQVPVNLYISRSDSLGNISFETNPGSGKKTLIIQTDGKVYTDYQIKLDDPFITRFPGIKSKPPIFDKEMKSPLQQRIIHMQVQTLFHPDKIVSVKLSNQTAFFGKPDERYLLDDYTRFPTLEEVMREYVPGVRVSKSKGHFQLRNADIIYKRGFSTNPMVLLDGVPVFDMDALMEIDPLKIKRLEAVTKQYYLQAVTLDGIVSLESYKNDLAGFKTPESVFLATYTGMEEQREFFNPLYETEKQKSSSVPDVRYVLYRSTNNLAASGEKINVNFYTSDVTGRFKVVLQGITENGLPGYFSTTFSVK